MKNNLFQQDITSVEQFQLQDILDLIQLTAEFEQSGIPSNILQGKMLAMLFFEPSTRTHLSFEAAAKRLGAECIGFAGAHNTSIKKGETFEDTIRVIDGYVDGIVIRHPTIGSAALAAHVAEHPVINAGDGANQHPTQTLLDLYTIQKTQGKLNGLNIGIAGDLKHGRVPHSLAQALTLFPDTEQYWIAPDVLRMPEEIKKYVQKAGVTIHETSNLSETLPQLDIIYTTRVQEERFEDKALYEKIKDVYVLQPEMFNEVKQNLRILDCLPRIFQIPTSIDELPYAYYFQQAKHGMYVRAALLAMVVGKV